MLTVTTRPGKPGWVAYKTHPTGYAAIAEVVRQDGDRAFATRICWLAKRYGVVVLKGKEARTFERACSTIGARVVPSHRR